MKTRHFVDTQDFSTDELLQIIELAARLKDDDKVGASPRLLEGTPLGTLFEESSTRTRICFEVAMTKLGGHALYLWPWEIHLGLRESRNDTADVLERMADVIEARTLKHATLQALAHQADVPVINGLTDYNHPRTGSASSRARTCWAAATSTASPGSSLPPSQHHLAEHPAYGPTWS